MTDKFEKDPFLSTAKNALRILNSFTLETPEKRVRDLAIELGIGKSTISRLLSTLASEGYVIKDSENQKYRLGLKILELNSIVSSQLEINRAARSVIKNLVKETGEAAVIAILEDEVVDIEQIECSHPDPILTYIGSRSPVHCTGSGKLLLAYHEKENLQYVLESGLTPYTLYTVTDPDVLRKQLAGIRESGFCYCESEYLDDVASFSAPIRNYSNIVVAAISLIGPLHRIHHLSFNSLKSKVIKAAKEISKNLGYYGL